MPQSCNPNAVIRSVFCDDVDPYKPLLVIFARKPIKPGREITISYKGDLESGPDDADSDSDDTPRHGRKYRKKRKAPKRVSKQNARKKQSSKKSSAAQAGDQDGAIDAPCYCGSSKCTGSEWRPVRPLSWTVHLD